MWRFVLAFPVLSGKTDEEVKAVAEEWKADPQAYQESRKRAGISLERAYLMKTPMSNFVVVYTEGEKDLRGTTAALFDPALAINRRFAEHSKEVHGIDVTQLAQARVAAPETVMEWVDDEGKERGQGMAFVAPLMANKMEAGRAFGKEATQTRKEEFTASRRALGENVEVVTVTQTPNGDFAAVYLEGEDAVEANRKFAASQSVFDRWFKDECKKLFPPFINFDEPLPPIEEFFDSSRM